MASCLFRYSTFDSFSRVCKTGSLGGWERSLTFCFVWCSLLFPSGRRRARTCTRRVRTWSGASLSQLESATRSVDVAMYSFTDRELAGELAALARKGVCVRVYRDREQFSRRCNGVG